MLGAQGCRVGTPWLHLLHPRLRQCLQGQATMGNYGLPRLPKKEILFTVETEKKRSFSAIKKERKKLVGQTSMTGEQFCGGNGIDSRLRQRDQFRLRACGS